MATSAKADGTAKRSWVCAYGQHPSRTGRDVTTGLSKRITNPLVRFNAGLGGPEPPSITQTDLRCCRSRARPCWRGSHCHPGRPCEGPTLLRDGRVRLLIRRALSLDHPAHINNGRHDRDGVGLRVLHMPRCGIARITGQQGLLPVSIRVKEGTTHCPEPRRRSYIYGAELVRGAWSSGAYRGLFP